MTSTSILALLRSLRAACYLVDRETLLFCFIASIFYIALVMGVSDTARAMMRVP